MRDIGAVAAQILINTASHVNKAYDLTCNDILTFGEMAEKLSAGLGLNIQYQSPNLIRFFIAKRKQQIPVVMILVMIMLHFLPRFQSTPPVSNWVQDITQNPPISFEQFVMDNKKLLMA